MPSGAKKRKAAKKKLQKKVHNFSSNKGSDSLSQGSDDTRSHDERNNGGVEVEREGNIELGGVKNYDEGGAQEMSSVEGNGVRETIATENVVESGLKQNVEEILQPFDEKVDVASKMENIVEKVIPVVDRGAENIYELVKIYELVWKLDEGLLPHSSGVKALEGCCVDDDCKVSETHKYAEQQPLLSSAPITVRRTSWMDCCGLVEVFSGGSSK